MRYYYRFFQIPEHEPYEYYETEEINTIPIYKATTELDNEFNNGEHTDLWPVHDPHGFSWVAKEYKNEDEARLDLGVSLNLNVFEYIYNL